MMAQVLYPYSPLLTYYRPDIDKETLIVDIELEIACPMCIAYIIFQALSMNAIWKYFHTHRSPKTNVP